MKTNKQLTRREFFRTCGRVAIAGGLATAAALLWKRKTTHLDFQKCVNRGICSQCGIFNNCQLPQALSAKKNR